MTSDLLQPNYDNVLDDLAELAQASKHTPNSSSSSAEMGNSHATLTYPMSTSCQGTPQSVILLFKCLLNHTLGS